MSKNTKRVVLFLFALTFFAMQVKKHKEFYEVRKKWDEDLEEYNKMLEEEYNRMLNEIHKKEES